MALKGTLADIGIIDLVQFPHAGRKTGELVVSADGQEGRLSYDKGSLVHASTENYEGLDALVLVVGWTQGTFEFLSDVAPTRKTIDMDLHRAVMQALKLHDEQKEEEQRRKLERSQAVREEDGILSSKLEEFVSSVDFVVRSSVISPDGSLRAAADGVVGPPEGIEKLEVELHNLLQSYPRGKLNRAILVDEHGTVVLIGLQEGDALIVAANKEASLGSVSIAVGRLAATLG
ncbi:MAG: DUF4388 domain-containing protein [Desulfomonile tiedjei]|uniref:DUF4388 domain-containing protein n=1 Tax=Desulfomonile tiedjei TaxID=2358 RepID=A0A9D6Z3C3_9BACT|nr:DUF4388 domain-containing protein [Desulfomonile tiedjei]